MSRLSYRHITRTFFAALATLAGRRLPRSR